MTLRLGKQFLTALLDDIVDNVFCRIQPTTYGVGVFALRNIPKGINPFRVSSKLRRFKSKPFYIELDPDIIADDDRIQPRVKQYIHDMCWYTTRYGFNYGNALSWYLNHSIEPNFDINTSTTLKPIHIGEELVIDYRFHMSRKQYNRMMQSFKSPVTY